MGAGRARASVARGDEPGAAATALRFHGADVFGFLLGVLGRGRAASDVYAGVGERVRQDLGRFRWRCSLRTWMYVVARLELRAHAARSPGTSVDVTPAPVTLADPTTTVACRRTDLGEALASIRGRLPVDDRALLILRVDRGLDFSDLALTELGADATPGALAREAGRLRARLEHIRDELGRAAVEHRLLAPR